MPDTFRFLSTVMIWGCFTGIIAIITSGGYSGDPVPLVAIGAFAAWMSTRAVWGGQSKQPSGKKYVTLNKSGKSKRTPGGSIDRLLDALSEDDLYELRRRLTGEFDDEPPATLEDLLDDYERGESVQ